MKMGSAEKRGIFNVLISLKSIIATVICSYLVLCHKTHYLVSVSVLQSVPHSSGSLNAVLDPLGDFELVSSLDLQRLYICPNIRGKKHLRHHLKKKMN